MPTFDGFQEIVSSIIDAGDEIREAFSIGSPEDNDLVELMRRFEVPAPDQLLYSPGD